MSLRPPSLSSASSSQVLNSAVSSVVGNPGSISHDQSLLIIDSTLFDRTFHDKASYVLGSEDFEFNLPIEVRMLNERDDLAIYRRKNGSMRFI